MPKIIDIQYDMRTDASRRDPDAHSATLRKYHKLLWNKPLPNGKMFALHDNIPGTYLHHKSDLGEFFLSSDSIVHTYSGWKRTANIIAQVPKQAREDFLRQACTIGGYLIFPSNSINEEFTINRARGLDPLICDRIDLTIECIRRFYIGRDSPLHAALVRYSDFFALFDTFDGYINHFLLHDLVNTNSEVLFSMNFDNFTGPAIPQNIEEYAIYREKVLAFVAARNRRIQQYAESLA